MDRLDFSAKQGLTYLEVLLYPTKTGVSNGAASGGQGSCAELCERSAWDVIAHVHFGQGKGLTLLFPKVPGVFNQVLFFSMRNWMKTYFSSSTTSCATFSSRANVCFV